VCVRMSLYIVEVCGRWMTEYFLSFGGGSNLLTLTVVIGVTVGSEECIKGGCVLSLNRVTFGVPYYKLFLDKRCGIQKNC